MALPLPVTVAQVGTYFVGQYYQMLQNQPAFVHQFYNDASTMLRIEGNTRETATAMLQIHQLVMTLNYTGIEIKTAHSLESFSGGVLVIVTGSVCLKNFNGRKKFTETFFLAPQEKGYFVMSDIFHYVDEEQILQHPIVYLPQSNLDMKHNSSATAREQVNTNMLGGDIQPREFVAPSKVKENGSVNDYKYPDEQLKQVSETEINVDDNFAAHSNGSLQGTPNTNLDHLPSPIEEPVVETQKHTYASIVAKGQNSSTVPSQTTSHEKSKGQNSSAVPSQTTSHEKSASTENAAHVHENHGQSFVSSPNPVESSQVENSEEAFVVDDDVEVKSVYVRNVPTMMSASEIGEEFKKFGKIIPDGVAIRTRKDIDVCYAFVEFEDIVGVQNAIKASTVEIGGHQLYIEERRPNRNTLFRGGRVARGGRGRHSYHMDGQRGRFSSRGGYGRGTNQDGFDRDHYYNRPRGNGFYRQATARHERVYSHNQQGFEE